MADALFAIAQVSCMLVLLLGVQLAIAATIDPAIPPRKTSDGTRSRWSLDLGAACALKDGGNDDQRGGRNAERLPDHRACPADEITAQIS
jgi:hypothetical protein